MQKKEEKLFKDGFGFIPIEVSPGRLKSLLGEVSYKLDSQQLEIFQKDKALKIPYSEIVKTVAENKNTLKITSNNGEFSIAHENGAPSLKLLLDRLIEESDFYIKAQNGEIAWPEAFKECLSFRALPFVWATELLLQKSIKQNCSDVHFEPFENEVKITFRKRDEVSFAFSFPVKSYERILSRMKYLAGCQNHVQNRPQEGAFRHKDTNIDIRLSTFPSKYGERTALRFINTVQFNNIESLGWPGALSGEWLKLCSSSNGLILITGPVGSGKTTALYATLCELAKQKGGNRIVTIEDPVEGRVPEICQSSLEEINNLTLAEAFKHILRQDPDIIALGEIRDAECVREALQAGLSGHIVFATFHAGSADEACLRIKQMGIDNYLVFNGLKAILSLELKQIDGKVCPSVHLKEMAKLEGEVLR